MPNFKKLSPEELDGGFHGGSGGGGAEMPSLSELDVLDWVGRPSLQRGRAYAQEGRVINTRRTGQTLKALCYGSEGEPYRVEIELTEEGLQGGTCSCPVGDGGRCKHAAAMLLIWIKSPDSFGEVEPMESVLARRSPDELLRLIRQMVARHPDLESLIELPVPGQSAEKPVKVSLIRNETRAALAQEYDAWAEGYPDPARKLEPLLQLADSYLNAQSWHNAATVFETMALEILEVYGTLYDDEGEVQEVVNRCVAGLGICLKALDDPVEREPLLNALFYVHQWDIDNGGIDMGHETMEILTIQSRPDEKKLLAKWARGAAEGKTGWEREAWGSLLLKLEAEQMDDEAYLKLCRKMGQTGELVARLLKLGRTEEAVREARKADDLALLALVPTFEAHRQHPPVVQELKKRAKAGGAHPQVVAWLRGHALAQGNDEEALPWSEQIFWESPSLEQYQQLKALATKLNRWATLRPTILAQLKGEKRYRLLIHIHLEAKEAREALEALALARQTMTAESELSLRVARLAEQEYPLDAVALYREGVERLIGERSRQSYATAAAYLVRVKQVYLKRGQEGQWKEYLAKLRAKYPTLRALKEELGKAGL